MFVQNHNRLASTITLLLGMLFMPCGPVGHAATVGQKLNHDLDGWNVLDYVISDDSNWVVFRADDYGSGGLNGLFSVPADGSLQPFVIAVQQNGAALNIDEYLISPSNDRVIFSGDLEIDGVVELFSRSIDLGGERVKLNHPLGGWSVLDLAVSDNGWWVVYRADDFGGRSGLYAVPANGSAQPVTLVAPAGAGADVLEFTISPDSSSVILLGDLDTNGVDELYRVPINGSSQRQKLNHDLGVWSVTDFAISGNGVWVAYRADDISGRMALYSVRANGGADPIILDAPSAPGDVLEFTITGDSQRVIYRGDLWEVDEHELFSTRINGLATPLRISHDLGDSDVLDFLVSPDGAWAVYRTDDYGSSLQALYSVPANGSVPAALLAYQAGGAPFGIHEYAVSADSNRVVWRGDLVTDGVDELFSRSVNGSGAAVKLNHDLGVWSVLDFDLSPNGRWVVYRADDIGGGVALYCAHADGAGSPVILAQADSVPGDVLDFAISPNSVRVIYRGDLETNDENDLFTVKWMLFGDGFDFGDLSAWSSSTP